MARPESGLVSSPAALLEVVLLAQSASESVPYQQKYVRPAGHLKIGDRWMKRYQITDDPTPIDHPNIPDYWQQRQRPRPAPEPPASGWLENEENGKLAAPSESALPPEPNIEVSCCSG